ncbi:prepilin-type N-terminal cleavage/methylation domain-containing protein [Opitutaceae bacterium TAV1]|nr:prepilin-type N-terminal cleavage/methylation domain-containing protein [Opitutaceae bacterium TAV1]
MKANRYSASLCKTTSADSPLPRPELAQVTGQSPVKIPSPVSSAFTLIELLTVIAIIGILAAILIPTVAAVRKKADASVCLGRMRQIGIASAAYMVDNRGKLPGPFTDNYVCGWYASNTADERGTLAGRLQPYIAAPAPRSSGRFYPEVFKCPTVVKNPSHSSGYIATGETGIINSKTCNIDVRPPDAAAGTGCNPWGKGNDSNVTQAPYDYTQLNDISLARTWAIRECSVQNATPNATRRLPAYVPHGDTLNVLFFDWHVAKLPADDFNL